MPQKQEKKRVLIVGGSEEVRRGIAALIEGDQRLEIVGAVATVERAVALTQRVRPDVIAMDVRLQDGTGVEATRSLMATIPTPIVMVAAVGSAADKKLSMDGLRAGALSVVERPPDRSHRTFPEAAIKLRRQLVIMSQVSVIRQRRRVREGLPQMARTDSVKPAEAAPRPAPCAENLSLRLVGIVSSTGGPKALVTILRDLGRDFPLPIALVQHISPNFVPGFASWLSETTPFRVVIGEDGGLMTSGNIYIAPGDRHLEVDGPRIRLSDGPPVALQRPSGNLLLQSMAKTLGNAAMGVVLTGMGEDGAEGLLAIHQAGGYTLVEAEETAVVFGMPAASIRLGAAREVLPVTHIAGRLRALVRVPGKTEAS